MRRSRDHPRFLGLARPLAFVGVGSGSHRAHLQARPRRARASCCGARGDPASGAFRLLCLAADRSGDLCGVGAPGRDAVVGRPPSPHPTEVPHRHEPLDEPGIRSPATLVDSTNGDRSSSRIWNELLSTYGVEDVLSVVFRDQYGCWAFLDLWRSDGDFTNEECSLLASVVAAVTAALRRSLCVHLRNQSECARRSRRSSGAASVGRHRTAHPDIADRRISSCTAADRRGPVSGAGRRLQRRRATARPRRGRRRASTVGAGSPSWRLVGDAACRQDRARNGAPSRRRSPSASNRLQPLREPGSTPVSLVSASERLSLSTTLSADTTHARSHAACSSRSTRCRTTSSRSLPRPASTTADC